MGKAQSRDRGPGPCVHTPLRSEEECPGANSTAILFRASPWPLHTFFPHRGYRACAEHFTLPLYFFSPRL